MILKCNLGPTPPHVTGHETKRITKITCGEENLAEGLRASMGNKQLWGTKQWTGEEGVKELMDRD